MNHLRPAIISLLLTGCLTTAVLAAGIEKIEPSAPTATLVDGKAAIKFTITGVSDDADNCGYWVDYGDGDSPDTRVLSKSEGLLPRVMEHTFTKPGGFSVQVKGQRVKALFGCRGDASTMVTILAPGGKPSAVAVKSAAPLSSYCPDGWQVQARSVDRKTGAFSCTPVLPTKKIECGPGLAYYESGGSLGCRKGK